MKKSISNFQFNEFQQWIEHKLIALSKKEKTITDTLNAKNNSSKGIGH